MREVKEKEMNLEELRKRVHPGPGVRVPNAWDTMALLLLSCAVMCSILTAITVSLALPAVAALVSLGLSYLCWRMGEHGLRD